MPSPVPRLTLGISTLLTSQTRSRRVETSKAPNPHCLFHPSDAPNAFCVGTLASHSLHLRTVHTVQKSPPAPRDTIHPCIIMPIMRLVDSYRFTAAF